MHLWVELEYLSLSKKAAAADPDIFDSVLKKVAILSVWGKLTEVHFCLFSVAETCQSMTSCEEIQLLTVWISWAEHPPLPPYPDINF